MTSSTNLVRPSRDGDQFHYLWAARRCLGLLSLQSDLVGISIEGVSPEEQGEQLPVTVGEEVIDVAEYFGSEDIQEARLVRYIQLKHSTLQANAPWTASGLEKTIKGFVARYNELLQILTIDVLLQKLEFLFVTNRPINNEFSQAVEDARNSTTPRHPKELKKLVRFTGLEGEELSTFCKVLHFNGRQDDYWNQRNILFQDVSYYLAGSDVDAPLRLKELVTRKASSEGKENPIIGKMDVLKALNTDTDQLFPAECKIKAPELLVQHSKEPEIIQSIINTERPVVIHASSGVGKTVFATRIAHGLPEGSVCILYDCFGNSLYRNASGYRHRHKDGLVQIANELAVHKLCHLLIPSSKADASDYMKAFIHRTSQAITAVKADNPDALICIVLDAADNSQMAAEEAGEARSFVKDLIREKMPTGIRLVFLCRSHRQDLLNPPTDTLSLELPSFSIDETAIHLRDKFPDADERDVQEFHRLSSHNPRVQALALSQDGSLSSILRSLGPTPSTVESAMENFLGTAVANLKDSASSVEKAQIDSVCLSLAVLRPLIPITVLSKVSNVPENAIKSFALDLGRPLLITGDSIQFRDEPSETWFRDKFKPSVRETAEFIDRLKSLSSSSTYISSVIPQLMLEAGQFSELVDLVLDSTALPNTTPLERRDVEIQRLQFSLKAALRSKSYMAAAKLALKAGGEVAGENRQQKILEENTDLVAIFLETDTIQEIVLRRTFGTDWLGSHHAYEASLLSNRSELIGDARSRLRLAHDWLAHWSRLPSQEREKDDISEQYILELVLARINIDGPQAGAQELAHWTPREVSFKVGKLVVRRLIDHGRFEDIDSMIHAAGNNLCLILAAIIELREVLELLPAETVQRAFRLVKNTRVKLESKNVPSWDYKESILDAVVALVEAGLQHRICDFNEAASVLSRYLPNEPPRALSSRFTNYHFPVLRAYCLRAALQEQTLELHDLAHSELREKLKNKSEHHTSREMQDFRRDIGALLPWYQLWAAALLGRISLKSLDAVICETLDTSNRVGTASHYDDDRHKKNSIALLWLNTLHLLKATNDTALAPFLEWKRKLKYPLFTPTLTKLARLCAQKKETHRAGLDFAAEAFNLMKDEREAVDYKSEHYITVARSVLKVSKEDASAYFNEAIDIVSKVGEENLSRWDTIIDLAGRATHKDRKCAQTAYHFARCAELTYDYVDRDKHFDWHGTIEALCGLCPSSALTIMSRWRDRGFGWSERILPIAASCLIKNNSADARDILPLVSFRAEWKHHELLQNGIAECTTRDEKNRIAAYLYRYSQFSDADLTRIKSIIDENGLEIAAARDVVATAGDTEDTEEKPVRQSNKTDPTNKNWTSIFSDCDLTDANGLAQAYANFKESDPPYYSEHFFKKAIQNVPVGSESAFIKAIADIPELDLYSFRNFLESVPESWKQRLAITQALAVTLRTFCRRHCMGITKSRHYEVLPFKLACSVAGVSEIEIVDVVLDAVGETPDFADARRLFSLVGLLALKLSEDEALEVLKFSLEFFTPILEKDDGDGPWTEQLSPPSDVKEAIAGYIWASLAAPASTLRWEGAHAILGLAALDRQEILTHIMRLALDKKGTPFVDARLPFYSLHGIQWLLIALARTAIDFPTTLIPIADQITDWATKKEPHHLLIKLFAARTALTLIDHGLLTTTDVIKSALIQVSTSPFPVIESKVFERINLKQKKNRTIDNDKDRYYFGIDIGPYWYAPLGDVFGLPQHEVEEEALKVIRSDLNYMGEDNWSDDERSRKRLYKEHHTSHSHGSYPRADNLQFYHAYHAMMIVADKLLKSVPVHCDVEYGAVDEFAEWVERHDISRRDGRWLWDRRDPVPPHTTSWSESKDVVNKPPQLTNEDFNTSLFSNKMFNVWGCWTETDKERQRTLSIRSALVSPDKSSALLRTLGTAASPYEYGLPSASGDLEICQNNYSLKGWIVDNSYDRGLDKHDRWAGDVNFPPPGPADEFIQIMDIKTDFDYRAWTDVAGTIVMQSRTWGHYDESNRYNSPSPERGRRLEASRAFILQILKKLGMDLIIDVKIEQRRVYRYHESSTEDDRQHIPLKAKVYLLRSSGELLSIE